jgi:hypothetical protein
MKNVVAQLCESIKNKWKRFKDSDIEFIGVLESVGQSDREKKFILNYVSKFFNYPLSKISKRKVPNAVFSHSWSGSWGIGIALKNCK